jgi:hypothetical protein
MNIAGSIHANLRASLQSGRRLRGGPGAPGYGDYWSSLVCPPRRNMRDGVFKTRELMSA